MPHQPGFAQGEFAEKKKTTRREKFLTRLEALIPWTKLLAVIKPFSPKGERGRPPVGLEGMRRVYFLQQWNGLADEALEDALCDSQAMQGLALIDLSAAAVPDATTEEAEGTREARKRGLIKAMMEGAEKETRQGRRESQSLGASVRRTPVASAPRRCPSGCLRRAVSLRSAPHSREPVPASESAVSRTGRERASTLHPFWTRPRGDRRKNRHGMTKP